MAAAWDAVFDELPLRPTDYDLDDNLLDHFQTLSTSAIVSPIVATSPLVNTVEPPVQLGVVVSHTPPPAKFQVIATQTLQMDILRCKTPELVRKELWTHIMAYNLIRTIMAQSATKHGIEPQSALRERSKRSKPFSQ